ncbi:cyclic nucleotide-binding domain containing protein [Trichomonas vaginalis G3]|uniref:Cyclic nucleotide-binding domain containing protein n=1 Tax=Trichomonas vaginalis (strain ATCC PRA-98 / G3) TaxID=412133 RepID=A2E4S1_TRIV3|nr:cyclic nucleotide-binding domain containing protein family [Trichomonas vaginalis G3]EAY12381.1 cyclic nucleotide-binding domain containing protein [Trichomonas vaginalis G3]KAI5500799.1 cyclic nucleotide-binding domain containing protein family [Trichomonas vaginalis G3]|eukprot:XP_001324604.1 cyclic nucleotide-binding domain containing protein [Trichomonas vaginalis G3]
MSLSARTLRTPRRQRIIVVPRPPAYAATPIYAMSAVYRSLQTPASERTLLNIEAIYSYLKNWPVFTSLVSNEKIQKDICKAIQLEKYDDGEIIYKLDDLSDGWYLIYSGNVILVEKCDYPPTDPDEQLSEKYFRRIHNPYLKNQNFRIVRRATVSEDIGRQEMMSNSFRKQYCLSVGTTEVLRVDPYTFKFVLDSYESFIVQERAGLILHIRKLEPLFDYHDISQYVAESLKDISLERGTVINRSNPIENGFLLIQSGLIKVYRKINFSNIRVLPSCLNVGDRTIILPNGISDLVSGTYGESTILALPEMYTSTEYDYRAVVVKKVKGLILPYKDFFSLIPMTVQKKILANVLDTRNEQKVVDDYIDHERKNIWKSYRTKCFDEAIEINSVSKNSCYDDVLARSPRTPDSIPSYRPRTYHIARRTMPY